jgi:aldehyde:ferredoxin oxidoreductase
LEAKVFEAATGLPAEEVERGAERICNLQRAILIREGRKLPQADYPPEFNFAEPIPAPAPGKKVIVPGPGGETADITGRTLDRGKFDEMLKEYYRIRGWDESTGMPLPETLKKLGLDDLLTEIQA